MPPSVDLRRGQTGKTFPLIRAMIPVRTGAPYWTAKPRVPFWKRDGLATTHPNLAAQIRRQIEAQFPFAVCDDCLAVLLIAPVDEVHQAALVVTKEDGF